ncbi:hypothetical protein BH10ACT11_BH10ACT11_00100 [soil metagenome]
MSVRIHRISLSTNVERVALAAAAKGIAVEWVDHDPGDRAGLVELSGQDLVPVAEIEGEVIPGSMEIVHRLEGLQPEPALYPGADDNAARVAVFIEWFEYVWKRPPNEIEPLRASPEPNEQLISELRERTHMTLAVFEGLLARSDFLFCGAFGAADLCAFPFLKYAAVDPLPEDEEAFHHILADCLRPAEAPRLLDWIARIDAMPRA